MTLAEYLEQLDNVENSPRGRFDDEERAYRNRMNGKRSQALGDRAERAVIARLKQIGFVLVEKVNVAWHIKRDGRGKVIGAYPADKVSGDIRAQTRRGQNVLVEVKATSEPKLSLSRLKQHQRDYLSECGENGGLPLVAWYHDGVVRVVHWPIDDWRKGKPLTIAVAEEQANLFVKLFVTA